jgi:pimeloyl-ACP methyl ester carboxylesterase
MMRLAPDRICKLILYGTGPLGVLPGRVESIAQTRARLMDSGLTATATRIAATCFFGRGTGRRFFALCQAIGEKAGLQAALASLTAWENWDGHPGLAHIASPTLALWGSHDRSYDWSQPESLWRGIPNSDRKLPRQVDKSEVETSALNSLGLNFTGGTSPRDSCGRYSL